MSTGITRRDVLRLSGALSTFAAGLAIAGPAGAFQLLPAEDYAGVIEDSCGAANRLHRAMVTEVERQLGVSLDDAQARRMIEAIQCPNCGCSILKGFAEAAPGDAPF
ncbi:hypothetical protein JL100_007705 [Skermanella mucosa]|uniref:hypothetical protein n=1 Tax=Skermanella mucosa TaxID=1789672 RepID=UPI00192B6AAA|nr:hypothetical protein [Skermanella mucosa]UEM22623.1 hypothetical protein JL100_007705 [Skermanella mucosa]